MYLTVLSVARGLIPACGGVFQGTFSWLITLCQPALSQRGRKWLNLPSMTPHKLTRPVDIEEQSRSSTMDKKWQK